MDETSTLSAPSDVRATTEILTSSADMTLQRRFAWVSCAIGVPARSRVPLVDQSVGELRASAEPDSPDESERWPDDDWSDL
jgi:hypothetical protein